MMSKFVEVFDEYTGYDFLINVDHVVCINKETNDVQLTGNRHICVDKHYLEVIKDCFNGSRNKGE